MLKALSSYHSSRQGIWCESRFLCLGIFQNSLFWYCQFREFPSTSFPVNSPVVGHHLRRRHEVIIHLDVFQAIALGTNRRTLKSRNYFPCRRIFKLQMIKQLTPYECQESTIRFGTVQRGAMLPCCLQLIPGRTNYLENHISLHN